MSFFHFRDIPDAWTQSTSIKNSRDNYYKLLGYIETFIEEIKPRLPEGFSMEAWTINRAVTLFKGEEVYKVVSYESIEDKYVSLNEVISWCNREPLECRGIGNKQKQRSSVKMR